MNRADKKLYQMRKPKNINVVLLEKVTGTGYYKQADDNKAPAPTKVKTGGRTKKHKNKKYTRKRKTTFKKGWAKI
jgi:hypothetical protein